MYFGRGKEKKLLSRQREKLCGREKGEENKKDEKSQSQKENK